MKIIKFYASWCRPCGVLSHTLDSMTLPHPIETANIDKVPQLAGDYGVRGVPTLVLVDSEGVEQKRLVGLKTEAQIQEWLDE